ADAIRRNPSFHNLYVTRAELFASRGQLAEALRWQDEGARLAPTSPSARETQCELQAMLGMASEAEACAEQLFKDFPRSMIPGVSEIDLVLSVQRGEIDQFLMSSEALEGMPDGLKVGMGQAHFLGNNIAEARKLIQSARPELFVLPPKEIAPFGITTALIVAGIYEAEGNLDAAREMLAAVNASRAASPYVLTGGEFAPTIAALSRGDYDSAAQSLNQPSMLSVWWVFLSPVFDRDRENPVFDGAVENLRSKIKRQREDYLANPTLVPL
ncbi:MAG: hypothetical protein AAAFM81_13990, partial [Pseudomonadota bacterium]